MRSLTLACLVCSFSLFLTGCNSGENVTDEDTFEAPVLEAPAKATDAEPSPSELMSQLGINDDNRVLVSGGKIRELYLTQTNVTDLTPLKNLTAITTLHLNGCPVEDLSPLAGLPLETLYAIQSRVKDLTPLKGMPLKILDLTLTPVDDLSPLEGLPLEELYLEGTGVTDLTPLKGMPLRKLNLLDTKVTSIEAVAGLPLDTLWIPGTQVSSLEPLRGSSLASLDLARAPVKSLEPLKDLESLIRLNIEHSDVTDLTPLAGLQLERLIFTPSRIEKGIEVVRNMPSLQKLGTDSEADYGRLPGPEEFWARYDAGEFK